jgi:cytochrome P450
MVHAPAVGPIAFARGVRNRGFLHFAGDLWREHGDVFEAHVGHRRLLFVMHPDAVEQVTVSGRQRYDKKGSYDVVRKYLIGQGLVGSTGNLWRRQRKLMAPFFTPRGVATYADVVIRDSLRFAMRWEDLADERREVDLSEEMMLITASIILKAMFSSETPESITQMKSAVETMIAYVDTQMVPVRVPT